MVATLPWLRELWVRSLGQMSLAPVEERSLRVMCVLDNRH